MRGRTALLLAIVGLLIALPAAQAQQVSVKADLTDTDAKIDLCSESPETRTSIDVLLESTMGAVSTEEVRIDVVPESKLPNGSTVVLSQTTFYADARPHGDVGPFDGTDKAGTLRLDFLRLAADEGCSTVDYTLWLDAEAPEGSILDTTDMVIPFVVSIGEPTTNGSSSAPSTASAATLAAGQAPLAALAGLAGVAVVGARRLR